MGVATNAIPLADANRSVLQNPPPPSPQQKFLTTSTLPLPEPNTNYDSSCSESGSDSTQSLPSQQFKAQNPYRAKQTAFQHTKVMVKRKFPEACAEAPNLVRGETAMKLDVKTIAHSQLIMEILFSLNDKGIAPQRLSIPAAKNPKKQQKSFCI